MFDRLRDGRGDGKCIETFGGDNLLRDGRNGRGYNGAEVKDNGNDS